MMLRTFAFDLIDPEVARQQVLNYKQLCEERLANYLGIWDKLLRRYGPIEEITDLRLFCSYLTLTEGIMHERMYVEWCTWAAEQFKFVAENRGKFRTHGDSQCVECVESTLYSQAPPKRNDFASQDGYREVPELEESKTPQRN